MPEFKLVSFDLDGTLLNSKHQFSPRSEEMIKKLYEKGIHVVLATARPITVIRRLLAKLSIFQGQDALSLTPEGPTRFIFIPSNGGAVYDEAFRCLHEDNIHPLMCSALYKVLPADPEVNLNVFLTVTPEMRSSPGYTNPSDQDGDVATDEWVCRYYDEREAKVQSGAGFIPRVEPHLEEGLRTSGVKEILYLCYNPGKKKAVVQELQRCICEVEHQLGVTGSVRLSASAASCVDVIPVNMSKAAALRKVTQLLNISMSDCVAFGDGLNDAEILRDVGKGFVMGNANPELKATLPNHELIGTNDDDAVAITVEKMFQL